ncbi:MAG TPA: TorF family putative porin [Deferrisomatales bacterium]|nr:TorF family putative porin [Deferrisomatales bacterium]
MFHTFKKAAPLCAAALLTASVASADASAWLADDTFSGNVAITSDYVWRGVSQTDSNWAVQGGMDYAAPIGLYVGTWASNVAFGGSIEMDFYGGFANELAMGLSYDVGANYYAYPKSRDEVEFNFFEVYAKVGYTLPIEAAPISLGLGYNYSPDFFGEDGAAHYINGNASISLPMDISLSGEVGYQTVEGDKSTGNGGGMDGDDGFDYVHYRIGLGYSVKGFDLDLSYHATDSDAQDFFGESISDGRVVFSVSRAL